MLTVAKSRTTCLRSAHLRTTPPLPPAAHSMRGADTCANRNAHTEARAPPTSTHLPPHNPHRVQCHYVHRVAVRHIRRRADHNLRAGPACAHRIAWLPSTRAALHSELRTPPAARSTCIAHRRQGRAEV